VFPYYLLLLITGTHSDFLTIHYLTPWERISLEHVGRIPEDSPVSLVVGGMSEKWGRWPDIVWKKSSEEKRGKQG